MYFFLLPELILSNFLGIYPNDCSNMRYIFSISKPSPSLGMTSLTFKAKQTSRQKDFRPFSQTCKVENMTFALRLTRRYLPRFVPIRRQHYFQRLRGALWKIPPSRLCIFILGVNKTAYPRAISWRNLFGISFA